METEEVSRRSAMNAKTTPATSSVSASTSLRADAADAHTAPAYPTNAIHTPGSDRDGDASTGGSRWPRPSALTLWSLAVALLAFALSWHLLRTTSLWYDEAVSGTLAQQPFDVFWATIWRKDINMVSYYVLLREWLALLHLVGIAPTEVWLRLPSVLFTVGSVVSVLHLGWRFWGRFVGVVAAVTVAVNYLTLYAAQQARSYALYIFLLTLGWFALLHALSLDATVDAASTASPDTHVLVQRKPHGSRGMRQLWWLAYTAMMALAIYTQLMGAFVLLAQVIGFALLLVIPTDWRSAAWRNVRSFVFSLLGVGALISPILLNIAQHGKDAASVWIPAATPASLVAFILELANNSKLAIALMAAAILVAVLAARSSGTLARSLLMLCAGATPVLLAYAVTQPYLNLHVFYDRYLSSAVMPLSILMAAGLASAVRLIPSLPERTRMFSAIALAFVICVLMALQLPNTYYAQAQRATWRDPAEWIEARFQPGDGIVCLPRDWCSFPLGYYLDYALADTGEAHTDAASPGWWNWRTGSSTSQSVSAIAAYSEVHREDTIFLVIATNGPSSYDALIHDDLTWLTTHRHLVATRHDRTVTVYVFSPSSSSSSS